MAISQSNLALWNDILALYTTLRTKQSQRGIAQTAIPSASSGTSILLSNVNTLRTAINALGPGTAVPAAAAVGDLIKASYVNALKTSLDSVLNTQYLFKSGSGFLVTYTLGGNSAGRNKINNNSFRLYFSYNQSSASYSLTTEAVTITSYKKIYITYRCTQVACTLQLLNSSNSVVKTFTLGIHSSDTTLEFNISSYTGAHKIRINAKMNPSQAYIGADITVTNLWLSV